MDPSTRRHHGERARGRDGKASGRGQKDRDDPGYLGEANLTRKATEARSKAAGTGSETTSEGSTGTTPHWGEDSASG